ncbi:MAG: hypothetical protein M2R45_04738 [Verrucomicrobia subdivision 3 bacterium]|nr:hypothetical protein [Limisphaerales bacterium]MCS1415758.1 hypothetical protein [Limisphaerales bacterium]
MIDGFANAGGASLSHSIGNLIEEVIPLVACFGYPGPDVSFIIYLPNTSLPFLWTAGSCPLLLLPKALKKAFGAHCKIAILDIPAISVLNSEMILGKLESQLT